MTLLGKHILLGVTGGIAAYKAAVLLRLLQKAGAEVSVAMTKSAQDFVGSLTFCALSGKSVWTDERLENNEKNMAHIDLSRNADAILIAPCSANFMAKIAHGLADDFLSTLVLARNCPLIIAPAMNREMWEKAVTQRNLSILQEDKIHVLNPESGRQACGEEGVGRMQEPEEIVQALKAYFTPKVLLGKNVLITAGATFEALDPVRGMTNLSTGKMGFAMAQAAQNAGAKVTLISGKNALKTPANVRRVDVLSAQNMLDEVLKNVPNQDVFISVAAVSDYRPSEISSEKLKKCDGEIAAIALTKNPDILATVAHLNNPPFCVGFAAETQNLIAYAKQKRETKNIPMIVANLVQDGFGGDTNTLVICEKEGEIHLPNASKEALAKLLMEHLATRI